MLKEFWDLLCDNQRTDPLLDANPELRAFLGYCLRHRQHSRAQLLQDLYVLYALGGKDGGYFVEFGAADGVNLSNTFMLEQIQNWSGIIADPNPVWRQSLHKNRHCNIDHRCVWSRSGETLPFIVTTNYPEISTLAKFKESDSHGNARAAKFDTVMVETVSLNDLLIAHNAPRDFDYLSIDTEGSEFDILDAFDLRRFRPKIITVEHNYVNDRRGKMHALLLSHGYVREFEAISNWDDWYIRDKK